MSTKFLYNECHWLVMDLRERGISIETAIEMLKEEWIQSLATEQKKDTGRINFMRKKTYRLTVTHTCSGNKTVVYLFTPAEDIKGAVLALEKSSEFHDWKLEGIKEIDGIILWKGQTQ